MAEVKSRQAALIAAGSKVMSNAIGKKRVLVMTSPAAVAWADGDTFASGVRIPKGTRFLCDSFASHGALAASVVLAVGIRNFDTKAVIDADGIATGVSVAAAGRTAINNGDLVKDGAEYVTTVDTEVYATVSGANPTDDIGLRLEISHITYD